MLYACFPSIQQPYLNLCNTSLLAVLKCLQWCLAALGSITVDPFSLLRRPSDALWLRHMSHLPAASISLSVISPSQLCRSTPTRRSDCGSLQRHYCNSAVNDLLVERRANALVYKAKSKDLGTRAKDLSFKAKDSKIVLKDSHQCLAPDSQPHQHLITQLFTCRMLFLMPNQQCQSTEGTPVTETKLL